MKVFAKSQEKDSWWVIVLKIIAYAIGLIIGGVGTAASAQMLGVM